MFYGKQMYPTFPLVFDLKYESLIEANNNANSDGVFPGRFIFVTGTGDDDKDTGFYRKRYNDKSKNYYYEFVGKINENINTSSLQWEEF